MKLNVTGNTGGALSYSSGSMTGEIVARILVAGQASPTRFSSRCIAEAAVENDGDGDYLIEAEFEGTANNPPWAQGQRIPAVLSVSFQTDGANGKGPVGNFSFGLEQGTTCNEYGSEFNMAGSAENGAMSISPSLNTSPGETRSRASIPGSGTGCSGVNFGD